MPDLSYLPREQLGLLHVGGSDARRFLHAQTTQNIADLPPDRWTRAAWLSAKGRVRTLFDVVPCGNDFWLVMPADNVDWMAAELGRFVLRTDVRLAPIDDLAVYSLVGRSDPWLAARELELVPAAVAVSEGITIVAVASDRIDAIGDPEALARACQGLDRAGADEVARRAIAAGRPEIPADLRERYTPHMLSLDLGDAVSFTKGCYPGQEVVARTQNLGQAKRRLRRLFLAEGPRPAPGTTIVGADGREAGEVNRVAGVAGGAHELLAVARLSQPDESLTLTDGRLLEALPLPWADEPAT